MKSIFTLLTLLIINLAFAQEVVQWRGDNRDGIYHEKYLLKEWPDEGPELLWFIDFLGEGHASAAVTDKRIYTSGTAIDKGFVIAFDNEGKEIWRTVYGPEWVESWPGVRTTPLIYKDKIYLMSGFGVVYCMNREDGKLLWEVDLLEKFNGRNIKWGMTENLVIDDGKLFCTPGGVENNIVALDKNTGKTIWKSKAKGELNAYCSPQVFEHNGRKILATHTASSIIGLDAKTGEFLWSHPQPNKYSVHANTPLYHDGQLLCTSGYGKGSVMLKLSEDGNSVTEQWRNTTLDSRMGGMILKDGIVYGSGDFSRVWVAVDWETGRELSTSKMIAKGNLIYADGMLYCYGESGEVALVKPKNGQFNLISKFRVPYGSAQHWAHLVIDNQRLFVRHGNALMVYDIGQ